MSKTFNGLRKKYPQFVYESFAWEMKAGDLVISFVFKIPSDIVFSPRLTV